MVLPIFQISFKIILIQAFNDLRFCIFRSLVIIHFHFSLEKVNFFIIFNFIEIKKVQAQNTSFEVKRRPSSNIFKRERLQIVDREAKL